MEPIFFFFFFLGGGGGGNNGAFFWGGGGGGDHHCSYTLHVKLGPNNFRSSGDEDMFCLKSIFSDGGHFN